MSDQEAIKVLLVDDHPILRYGLKGMLLTSTDITVVGEAGSGRETLAKCQESLPDVILMDLVMPGMDGLATTRAVLDLYPEVKVLVLTSFPDQDMVHKLLEAGAVGFLVKNVAIDTLRDAIRSANAGQSILAPEATEALIQAAARPPQLGHDLSERELEVLALVVAGMRNDEIAERLVISPNTVRNHVSACISKLGAANRAQAAALAVEHKLLAQ